MVFAGIRMLMPSKSLGGARALPGGGVNWRSCLPKAIATGAIVASLAAGRIGTRIPGKALKRGFGILVLVIAAYVAMRTLIS
jgi:uncharacterized membrane protein YfcA